MHRGTQVRNLPEGQTFRRERDTDKDSPLDDELSTVVALMSNNPHHTNFHLKCWSKKSQVESVAKSGCTRFAPWPTKRPDQDEMQHTGSCTPNWVPHSKDNSEKLKVSINIYLTAIILGICTQDSPQKWGSCHIVSFVDIMIHMCTAFAHNSEP